MRLIKAFVITFFILSECCICQLPNQVKVRLGVDALIESGFKLLKNKRVALLTNHAGRTHTGVLTAQVLSSSKEFRLVSILTPEHGFYATVPAGKEVDNDELFNVPVYSLYGDNRRPTQAQLANCDAVVVDLQDIGIRSYTYISTLYKVMDACAEYDKQIIVLDRPNPISGLVVDGNTVDKGSDSFLGIAPVSYVHGCTIGELAKMFNEEGWLPKETNGTQRKCRLYVVKMKNWKRWMSWEDTHLLWYPTSPNIPTTDAIRGAAMLGIFGELGTISVGIGTTLPFQYLGTPDLETDNIVKYFGKLNQPGVDIIPAKFRPMYGKYATKDCNGFLLRFPLDNQFAPYTVGIKLLLAVRHFHKEIFSKNEINSQSKSLFNKVTGTDELFNALTNGTGDDKILKLARKGLMEYLKIRAKYLLYE